MALRRRMGSMSFQEVLVCFYTQWIKFFSHIEKGASMKKTYPQHAFRKKGHVFGFLEIEAWEKIKLADQKPQRPDLFFLRRSSDFKCQHELRELVKAVKPYRRILIFQLLENSLENDKGPSVDDGPILLKTDVFDDILVLRPASGVYHVT